MGTMANCVKEQAGKSVLLTPGQFINKTEPEGTAYSSVILPRNGNTIHWLAECLSNKENSVEPPSKEKAEYRVTFDADGSALIEQIRSGEFKNHVRFAADEIQGVADELRKLGSVIA